MTFPEFGDPGRFARGEDAGTFAELAPTRHQSGERLANVEPAFTEQSLAVHDAMGCTPDGFAIRACVPFILFAIPFGSSNKQMPIWFRRIAITFELMHTVDVGSDSTNPTE